MKKGSDNRFIGGPWPHAAGFEIKYCLNGKVRSEYRGNEVEAKQRAEYWKEYFEDPAQAQKRTQAMEHTIDYWNRVLRQHAEAVLKDPENKALLAAARALSGLAAEGLKCAKYQPPPQHQESQEATSEADLDGLSAAELSTLLQAHN